MQVLLAAGADVELTDGKGNTALHYAAGMSPAPELCQLRLSQPQTGMCCINKADISPWSRSLHSMARGQYCSEQWSQRPSTACAPILTVLVLFHRLWAAGGSRDAAGGGGEDGPRQQRWPDAAAGGHCFGRHVAIPGLDLHAHTAVAYCVMYDFGCLSTAAPCPPAVPGLLSQATKCRLLLTLAMGTQRIFVGWS